jgi:Pyruvate/2-oxoacid:ferredoxin oxidoreductase delta subunit
MEVYARLQKLLDIHPSGAPVSQSFDKILKLLFSTEEAEMACCLKFDLQSLEEVQQKTGKNPEILKQRLDEMADRGCIVGVTIKDHSYYALLPTLPGFYEFPFMRPERNAKVKELGMLWRQYYDEGFSKAVAGTPTPQMRVIPIQKTIPNTTEVLYYEQVSNMIEQARLIAVTNCACKEIMNACSKPREVCMAFDNSARYLLEKNWARQISKRETLNILKEAEAAGMVHCVRNSKAELSILCNCCTCCCMLLRGITELNNPNLVATSAYVVKFDEAECIGCRACAQKRCPVHAIKWENDHIEIATEKCIGCGLCASICQGNALRMVKRVPEPSIPDTENELTVTLLKEKGKLDLYRKFNNK